MAASDAGFDADSVLEALGVNLDALGVNLDAKRGAAPGAANDVAGGLANSAVAGWYALAAIASGKSLEEAARTVESEGRGGEGKPRAALRGGRPADGRSGCRKRHGAPRGCRQRGGGCSRRRSLSIQ
jgi:hypothetical protein